MEVGKKSSQNVVNDRFLILIAESPKKYKVQVLKYDMTQQSLTGFCSVSAIPKDFNTCSSDDKLLLQKLCIGFFAGNKFNVLPGWLQKI